MPSDPNTALRPPRVLEQTVHVDCGCGAQMTMPRGRLEWNLRYGDPQRVKFAAASVVESYRYLVLECTKEEAWQRIELMRAALEIVNNDE